MGFKFTYENLSSPTSKMHKTYFCLVLRVRDLKVFRDLGLALKKVTQTVLDSKIGV